MENTYLDKVTLGDCREHIPLLSENSIDLFLSDIPYGISLDDWDVLHENTNSALLGQSPAQKGKTAFKRRGKPINGWSQADRNIGKEYQEWCQSWSELLMPKMKKGSSLFIFGARRTMHRAINAFEDSGFLLKDILAWKKPSAHHRAQRISIIFERRGLEQQAEQWRGWRLGNLAPIFEPIAWFVKPYKIGGTIADNVLEHSVGAMNFEGCQIQGTSPTNMLEFGFSKNEKRVHEAQKPVKLIEFLIKLTTIKGQTVLDPFIGSGTTAIAAKHLERHFIGFEINSEFHQIALQRLISRTNSTYQKPKQTFQTSLLESPSDLYES
ncbi:DNA-methyltransferase [Candidatus Leptofilum sp.]|uniref:DNA-methyltransferase n=1 Tax=Candidatus Leptofilum sp. TaxID=3241576 RepID=UPI003B5A5058